ncbi:MAG: hypothetical protein M0R20_01415 [Candidatus Omnitrophica bacterium]|jgi:hypothetical protein|nr:hypothetical protein [Candidatus Omnitrophota bacterium]
MGKTKILKISLIAILGVLFFIKNSYADMVFPLISHQFIVRLAVPPYYSIIMAALILLIEVFFIRNLFATSYIISFFFSFIVNLISSIAGVFIIFCLDLLVLIGIELFSYFTMRLGIYLGIILGYVLTVLLEGVLLFPIALVIKKRVKMSSCMKTSAIMNLCSYLIILIGVIITDIFTKGANFQIY